jgi:C_GCAxxG_C_C family probable redox protein
MESGNDAIPKIASGFGGGIGNTGAVCGAVVGAVMAMSLKMKRGDTMEDWLRIAAVAQDFRRRFEAEMGTINCRELTGADLTTEEGIKQLMNSDLPQKVCFPAVGTAYRLVLDLLQENI